MNELMKEELALEAINVPSRRCASITMTEELFRAVKRAAREADEPLTVWCREAIKRRLEGV